MAKPELVNAIRPILAEEVRNLRLQLVQLANSKIGDTYLYAGHQTDVAPYSHQIEIAGGAPGAVEFGLAADATDVTVEIRDAAGALVQTLTQGDGSTPGSGGTAGTNSIAWSGPDGEYSFTVTAGSAGTEVVDYETYNGDSGDIRLILTVFTGIACKPSMRLARTRLSSASFTCHGIGVAAIWAQDKLGGTTPVLNY